MDCILEGFNSFKKAIVEKFTPKRVDFSQHSQDVILSILEKLPQLKDFYSLSRVNRRLRNLVQQDRIWKPLCQGKFGMTELPEGVKNWYEAAKLAVVVRQQFQAQMYQPQHVTEPSWRIHDLMIHPSRELLVSMYDYNHPKRNGENPASGSVWDKRIDQQIPLEITPEPVMKTGLSAHHVAAITGTHHDRLAVWNMASGRVTLRQMLPGRHTAIACSEKFVVAGSEFHQLFIKNIATQEEVQTESVTGAAAHIEQIIIDETLDCIFSIAPGAIHIWSLSTGICLQQLPNKYPALVNYSHKNKTLTYCDDAGKVQVMNMALGTIVGAITLPDSCFMFTSFYEEESNQLFIAYLTNDLKVHAVAVWDLTRCEIKSEFKVVSEKGASDFTSSIAYDRIRKLIFLGNISGIVSVYDEKSGSKVSEIKRGASACIGQVICDPQKAELEVLKSGHVSNAPWSVDRIDYAVKV
jgi:hypothetical protein